MRIPLTFASAVSLASAIAFAGSLGCSSKAPSQNDAGATAIVVGVQGEQVNGFVGTVRIQTTVDDVSTSDDTVSLVQNPSALPKAVTLTPRTVTGAGLVKVRVDAYSASTQSVLTLTRTARTSFVQGETKLLRILLENRCLFAAPPQNPCDGTQTCTEGRCQDDTINAADLEDYSPTWAADAPDICKPVGHGDPVVLVGTGQTDYLPITDGQTLQAERGPQGGHHIWIATRLKNLKQAGSTTSIVGTQPDTGVQIPPTVFVFTLEAAEGGYCKLYGLRYQLDNGGIDYKQFLGKPLDIRVTVQDQSGAQATGVAHINVAPTVLGE